MKAQNYLTGYTETDPQVGSNTTNYLSKWDGSALITSQIFDNGTNVSIGSSSSVAKLYVNGSTRLDLGSDATGDIFYRSA